jgi:hypothetical protein
MSLSFSGLWEGGKSPTKTKQPRMEEIRVLEKSAMTHPLTPPTLAQVLREFQKALILNADTSLEPSLVLLVRILAPHIDRLERAAALEAPARDAGREVGYISCTVCGDADHERPTCGSPICPNPQPTPTEPPPAERDAGREVHRCANCGGTGLVLIGQGTKPCPVCAEPPPPAWDARPFLIVCFGDDWYTRDNYTAGQVLKAVEAAYTAGQRAAGVQVPEEMPEWFPELLNKFMWCNSPFANFGIDEPGFYAALRTRLTQTREG